MRTGRLLSLQDFVSKQDPNNFIKSSKNPAENIENYAEKIITAHDIKEAAAKEANDALQQSHDNDNVPDEFITPYYEDIHNIRVEDDEDIDKLLPDDDENEFDEKAPLKNVDDPALKVLGIV
ncbi:MAG: hypothetical protein GY821_15845 [Gammaproteobacteria bacterium]|nr:hypothetical protein [Gammaproteobacteria bacterium]